MPRTIRNPLGRCTGLFLGITLLGLLSLSANAQTPQKPNTDSALDNRMRSDATVDPLSMSLQLSINLGSYPGRDGLALPITMSYSSRLWGIHHVTTDKCGGFPPWTYYQRYRPEYGRGSMAGWTSPLGMSDAHGTVDLEMYDTNGHPVSTGAYKKIARIFATLPDGSRHELRKDDSLHNPTETITGKFYAVDDSRLVYDTTTATLYLPDGTRQIASSGLTYIDKNGNKIVGGGSSWMDWTDTMGRSFGSPLDTGSYKVGDDTSAVAFDKSFSVPGFNGGTLSYTMKWKKLEDVLTNTSDTLEYMGDTGNSGTCGSYGAGASPSLFVSTGDETQVLMETRVFDPVVLAEIDLPNGKSYNFTYNIYGEIDKVVYPTGAYDKFAHSAVAPLNPGLYDGDVFFTQTNRGVVSRTQSEDGTTGTEVTWTYGQVGRGVTNPDGTYSQIDVYPGTSSGAMKWGFESAIAGLPSEERTYSSSGTMLTRHIIERTYDSVTVAGAVATRNPRVTREISVKFEPGDSNALVSLVTYDYDSNSDPAYFADLNPILVKSYDYVVVSASTAQTATLATLAGYFSSSAPAKQVETDYLYDSNCQARNLTQIPTEVRIKDGSGNLKAKTHFYYDESSYQTTTSGTMPTAASGTWTDPTSELGSTIGSKRALPTTVRSYYDITNGYYIDTHRFYDQYGNVTKVRDGRGNDTTTAFDASYAFVLPTSVTTPVPDSSGTHGSSTAFTSSTAYDYSSGLPTSTTDVNGQTTTVSYADPTTSVLDPLLRPRVITAPNGQQTVTEYGDTSGSLYIKVSSQIDSSNWKVGYKYFDNLGRVKRTRSVDPAGDDYTLACYDNMGRVSKVTNPFRSYSTQTCSTTTGLDWTSTVYDAEGRVTSVTTPDTAHVDTAYALASSGSQIGTAVTVTDQASKVRRSVTNALGELIRIDEPTTSGLGTISSPNQATTYAYDTLNNLSGVTQGSQSRSFSYDALSRLTSATNPESGTVGYTYDANGNLYTKTDARSITTTYTYDPLNRVTARSYSDSTPAVAYYYDNVTNGLGKLKKVISSVSTTEYTGFDILGRVTGHKQTTAGTDYTTSYTYDLAGDLLTETYPSGRVVQNTLASDGSLSQVQSKPSGGSYTNRASSFVHTPAGAVQSLQLGNGKYENAVFNSRLQPTQIGLGTSTTDTSLLKLEYSYGTTANNGNVLSQTITVPGVTYPFVQTYTYDELNRLASGTETSNSSQNWKQEFSYDRYGNRSFVTGSGHTDTLGSCTTMCNPTFSSTTNRITSSGYSFDSSGNTTADPTSRSFVYDAENKQTSITSGGTTIGTYYYDGDGKRAKKTSSSDSTVFVYDAAGKLVEEYPTSSLTTVATAYVYAGSRLLSTETSSGTTYLTADHLGSPRINTNGSGSVVARHDFMPFGEDIATSQRTSGVGYISDSVRKRFTSYERDNETNLDFAQARYYSNQLGRFTSVDPLMASAQRVQPQSWNRYTYALNNPLRYVDQNGENYEDLTDRQKKLIDDWAARQNAAQKTDLSAQKIYDALGESQRSTFEAAANALENTTITGKDGTKINGLDTIKSVSFIYGQKPEGNDKEPSFRLYLELKDKMGDFIKTATNFHSVPGHKPDFPDSRQLNGGEPSPQISMSKDGKSADVDVDYESKNPFIIAITLCANHCTEMNSDVRADGHFDAHNKRFGNGPAGPLKRRYEPTLPK